NSYFRPVVSETLKADKYLLAVASLNYRKNIIATIQAFDGLSDAYPSVKLYIVGDLNSKSFKGIDLSGYLSNPNIRVLGRITDEELRKY
ncbi:glycosyltransferase, partial [Shigella sonnei]|nr:glycosyltransferase [Shigella sonnei]